MLGQAGGWQWLQQLLQVRLQLRAWLLEQLQSLKLQQLLTVHMHHKVGLQPVAMQPLFLPLTHSADWGMAACDGSCNTAVYPT